MEIRQKEVMEIMERIKRLKALEETGQLGAFILAIAVAHDLLLAIHQLLSIQPPIRVLGLP